MKKTAIIYASKHHENTRKLVKAIADKYDIVQIDAIKQQHADLSAYDLIGFASGIEFGKFYAPVEQFLQNHLPANKHVFFLYTCAKTSARFTASMRRQTLKKGSILSGEYGCKGHNSYGPWKLIGGMNKGHPNHDEINGALQFFEALLNGL